MRVQSLRWEDPLEGMATRSSILAWEISWTEEPGGLQSMGSHLANSWRKGIFITILKLSSDFISQYFYLQNF